MHVPCHGCAHPSLSFISARSSTPTALMTMSPRSAHRSAKARRSSSVESFNKGTESIERTQLVIFHQREILRGPQRDDSTDPVERVNGGSVAVGWQTEFALFEGAVSTPVPRRVVPIARLERATEGDLRVTAVAAQVGPRIESPAREPVTSVRTHGRPDIHFPTYKRRTSCATRRRASSPSRVRAATKAAMRPRAAPSVVASTWARAQSASLSASQAAWAPRSSAGAPGNRGRGRAASHSKWVVRAYARTRCAVFASRRCARRRRRSRRALGFMSCCLALSVPSWRGNRTARWSCAALRWRIGVDPRRVNDFGHLAAPAGRGMLPHRGRPPHVAEPALKWLPARGPGTNPWQNATTNTEHGAGESGNTTPSRPTARALLAFSRQNLPAPADSRLSARSCVPT